MAEEIKNQGQQEYAENISGQAMKCTPNIGRISICLDGMSSVLYRAHVV